MAENKQKCVIGKGNFGRQDKPTTSSGWKIDQLLFIATNVRIITQESSSLKAGFLTGNPSSRGIGQKGLLIETEGNAVSVIFCCLFVEMGVTFVIIKCLWHLHNSYRKSSKRKNQRFKGQLSEIFSFFTDFIKIGTKQPGFSVQKKKRKRRFWVKTLGIC